MQTTSQQTPKNASLDREAWMEQFVEDTRQSLMEADRKYPQPAPVDMEYFRATGIMRDKVAAQEQDTTKAG